MIIIITIFLSNGDKVIYEIDKTTYSVRMINTNSGIRINDNLKIYKFGDPVFYEFNLINEDSIKKKNINPITKRWENEDEFVSSLKPFIVSNYNGMQSSHLLPNNIQYVQYFIQIKELSEIVYREDIGNILSVIGDWYIFSYSDACDTTQKNLIRPIDVKVEWSEKFSDIVYKKIGF